MAAWATEVQMESAKKLSGSIGLMKIKAKVCLIKLKETINVSEAAGTEMTSIE
jgi:hypothetical protein